MNKVFEDYFSELQADMVSICLEYVQNKAEKIYIYCSSEERILSSDFFFCIGGKVKERHKLNNDKDKCNNYIYDTSIERQGKVLDILIEDLKKIMALCKEYQREMPTEIKLVYDVSKNSLQAGYKYDLVYSNDPDITADDIAMDWIKEILLECNN